MFTAAGVSLDLALLYLHTLRTAPDDFTNILFQHIETIFQLTHHENSGVSADRQSGINNNAIVSNINQPFSHEHSHDLILFD